MSQQPSRQIERTRSLMGQDKTPERGSGAKSSESLLTPPTTEPGEKTHASRSGTSPPPTIPPSYFERGQPGYSEPLPRGRIPSSRAPGFNPRPQPKVKRPSSTPLRNPCRTSVHVPPHQCAQRASSHQALQLGVNPNGTGVQGLLVGNGDAQPNNTQIHTPALVIDRPSLSFGPPITSQQPSGSSRPVSTVSDLAANQFRAQTHASRTTSSLGPESVPRRASYTSPYEQQESDEPVTQDGHYGPSVATNAATYLARREEEPRNGSHTVDYRGAQERQIHRTGPATNGVSRRPTDSYANQGDRPSHARGQYERSADIPQPRSSISATLLDVPSASKRLRSGNSSPTDQPATQRPRTSVTEPSLDNQLRLRGVGGPSPPQPRTSVAPSASFSLATISRRTDLAALSTPDAAARTFPPRPVDANPPRPSNVTPPNPLRSTSTARPNATDSGHRRPSLATPQRPSPSTNASLSTGRESNTPQRSTSTPHAPRSSSIGSSSPAPTNTTPNRNGTRSTSLSSQPNSHTNAPNNQRPITPASSSSPSSAPSQTHTTNTRPPPILDQGFDYWSLTPHQRTTYRPKHTPYLIASLRSGVQGSLPNTDPSRPFRENNPEDPRLELITAGLNVTRAEAIGIILGQEEIRKQAKEKASTTKTPTTVDTAVQTTALKRPGTERRFREEMARLHPDSQDGQRRNASQPPPTSPATRRPRSRAHTIAAPRQQTANEEDDDEEAEDSRGEKGKKRVERNYRFHLPPNQRTENEEDDDDDDYTEHSRSQKGKKGKKREERHYRFHLPPDPVAPFQLPFGLSKSLLFPHSAPYTSLDSYDFMVKEFGFRTVAQYDTLCDSLYRDCKCGLSTPYPDHGLRVSAGYCVWVLMLRQGKDVMTLSTLFCVLLVYGGVGVGSVIAAVLVLLLVVWVLFL